MKGDVIHNTTHVELSFKDRVRVLFTGKLSTRVEIETDNDYVHVIKTKSSVNVVPIFRTPKRKRKGMEFIQDESLTIAVDEKNHLNDSFKSNKNIPEIMHDPIWKKAFKIYNENHKMKLHMHCRTCYRTVLNFINKS